ncbi:MAG TPA: glycerophosphodiester phosphodiesterase family protein [Terracidiphilus sp.]|nr:glycerophosphodiester phosphodiesterase family protein [Terracidiphilus sp.]
MSKSRILAIGHRGAAGHAPENTLASIERGIALRADMVEVDVQRTGDGALVLMHDKFVDRTTNGSGRLSAMRLDDLRRLDAGNGEKIPLLGELLEAAKGRVGLILETITPGIGPIVSKFVNDFGFRDPVIFASFLHTDLLRIREQDSAALTMALLEGVPIEPITFAMDAKATHVGIGLDSATPEFVDALHKCGLQVCAYTADTDDQIDLAKSLNVDGIISNFPERIRD